MPLSLFVAFMQTFIFVLLSIIYIGEVSHHHDEGHGHADKEEHVHEHLKEEGLATVP
jgi:hypothetical protein